MSGFVDCVEIKIESGSGGDGIISWLRTKYQEKGGPAGGDGGKGGDVFLKATESINTLIDYQYKKFFQAENGEKGGKSNRTGASGKDLTLLVPIGTKVAILEKENQYQEVCDLERAGKKVRILRGGKGGKGNQHFSTSSKQAPYICYPGEKGTSVTLKLELKLIADVGIIGFPNAGKSTLISSLSASKAKIADYAFTTLVPNLGVLKFDQKNSLVLADVPGLIENASKGAGLGIRFLSHIERTSTLLHLIDISLACKQECLEKYWKINRELKNFNQALLDKEEIIVLNKIDACSSEKVLSLIKFFEQSLKSPEKTQNIFAISGVSGAGLKELKNFLKTLAKRKQENLISKNFDQNSLQENLDLKPTTAEIFSLEIDKEKKVFRIKSKYIEGWLKITDFSKLDSIEHFYQELKRIGLIEQLKANKIQNGDTVIINKQEMTWSDFSDQNLI